MALHVFSESTSQIPKHRSHHMRRLRAVSCASVLTLTPAVAASAQATMLARPIQFHNPEWSPVGQELLFESTLRGKSSIFIIRHDGTGLRQLTPDSIEAQQGRWSPDGQHVVVSMGSRGRRHIQVVAADGSRSRSLTTGESGERFYASYSPDGAWIAFQLTPAPGETPSSVYVMRADGSELRLVSDTALAAEAPTWQRGPRQLAFRQVAYPRRRWADMRPEDSRSAQAAAVTLSITVGDPTARPRPTRFSPDPLVSFADSAGVEGVRATRDGRYLAYTKVLDGWAGVYVYDRTRRVERRLIGGAGAGPLGYLRVAKLTPFSDTLMTYTSSRDADAPLRPSGTSYIRTVRRVAGGAWDVTDVWYDSAGAATTTQQARTGRGTLVIERESVRSRLDSAALQAVGDRAVGWVVPEGQPPRLFDYPAAPPLFARPMVVAAIAAARPAIGSAFVAPTHVLFSPAGLTDAVDSVRVLRRDSVSHATGRIPVLVLQHNDGQQVWVDETTGRTLIARGSAGPGRWWWHVVKGIRAQGPS